MSFRSPVLRAITEDDERWDDPSEDLLFDLLSDIENGLGGFLIVERTSDPGKQTYAQAARQDDGSYVVEHSEGSADRHYGTVVADMRAAHQLLTGWAFELPAWNHTAKWTQLRL
ncbi:hypothetical protein [Kribbella sp. CA-294648]|uniref:hypothetical protein n=1 Tax=Kribbella sp. CA-294648 TaxID=3239948 RepID=UPI003D8E8BDB